MDFTRFSAQARLQKYQSSLISAKARCLLNFDKTPDNRYPLLHILALSPAKRLLRTIDERKDLILGEE